MDYDVVSFDGKTINTSNFPDFLAGDMQNPPSVFETSYSDNFAPSNLSTGAASILDVLKYGFGRVVDQNIASIQAQNAQPQYAREGGPKAGQRTTSDTSSGNLTMMLLLAAGVFLVLSSSGAK